MGANAGEAGSGSGNSEVGAILMWRVDVPEEGLITEEDRLDPRLPPLWSTQTFTPHLPDTLWTASKADAVQYIPSRE